MILVVCKDQASTGEAVALCFSLVGNFQISVIIKWDFINDFSYHIFSSTRHLGSFTVSGLWMGPVKAKDFTWEVHILLNQVGTPFFFFFLLEPKNNCQNILGNWAMQSTETDTACVFLFPKLLWKLPKWCCLTESWASGNDRTFQQQKFISIVLNSCFPFLSSPPDCGVLLFNANWSRWHLKRGWFPSPVSVWGIAVTDLSVVQVLQLSCVLAHVQPRVILFLRWAHQKKRLEFSGIGCGKFHAVRCWFLFLLKGRTRLLKVRVILLNVLG